MYNASDDDLLLTPPQDNLSNTYFADGTNMSNDVNWTYLPGFCEAGSKNITLVVYDIQNETDSVSWNVSWR